MKLPNCESAYIPSAKLLEYLLSPTHTVGKAKAKFFRYYGFDETNIRLLEQGLLTIARTSEVQEKMISPYGMKYILEGELPTPNLVVVRLQTIWIIEREWNNPRFVTAYTV